MKRLRAFVAVTAAVAVLLAGCNTSGDGSYQLTAFFPQAVALFEDSRVKLMGFDVGSVDRITLEGGQVRVDFSVDADVPLPADVEAMIIPLTLIGERNLVLFPAFEPGDERIEAGAEIPLARTSVPAEVDDILEAIIDLAEALDPDRIGEFIGAGARVVDGRGDQFNQTLRSVGDLASMVVEQDPVITEITALIRDVTSTLNTRQSEIRSLLDSYASTIGMLADEREALRRLLVSLVRLFDEGEALLDAHKHRLPQDLARLAQLAILLETHVDSLAQGIDALPTIAVGVRDAYDAADEALVARITTVPVGHEVLRNLLRAIGIDPGDCIELGGVACEEPPDGGNQR